MSDFEKARDSIAAERAAGRIAPKPSWATEPIRPAPITSEQTAQYQQTNGAAFPGQYMIDMTDFGGQGNALIPLDFVHHAWDMQPREGGGGFMRELADNVTEMKGGLSVMAAPVLAAAGAGAFGAGATEGAGAAGTVGEFGSESVFGGGAGSESLLSGAGSDTLMPAAQPGASMITDAGMQTLDPETAQLLGINDGVSFSAQIPGEFGPSTDFSAPPGSTLTGGGGGLGGGEGLAQGDYNLGYPGEAAGANYGAEAGKSSSFLDEASAQLKKLGLSPASAGLLGVSALQALNKPQTPQATKTQEGVAGPNAKAASAVIQSGGTTGPAWATQKASIDATVDEQIRQQVAAMMQQAQNSGQGPDSQVTLQQINKLKNQLEAQRQALYAQAQQQNVQAALQTLGISNQALSSIANQQFQASNAGKQSAAQTAQIALMLQQLSNNANKGGGTASVVNQGNGVSA